MPPELKNRVDDALDSMRRGIIYRADISKLLLDLTRHIDALENKRRLESNENS